MRTSRFWVVAALSVATLFLVLRTAQIGVAAGTQEHHQESDRAAITKILNDQQRDWNRADVDSFLEGYWHSPELTFSGSSGIARGWDAVRTRYKKNYPDRAAMGQLDFSSLEFHFLGTDGALVLGHWHLARTQGDIGGVFSLVWQRFPQGWRIIHDHTSAVPDSK
jgi:beta-aspartyl-peptidase (threonine type)